MPIADYSTTAASNNSAPPNGMPEGQAPSTVNDTVRQIMADIRSWYETAQWVDYGFTPTRTGATTFTVSGDHTDIFVVNRRIKCVDSSDLYGYIASSSYGAPNTTVTVTLDSGSLSASLSAVSLSILTPTNVAIPALYLSLANGGTVAGAVVMNAGLTMGANIAMGGYKITGAGAGSTAGDLVRYEQAALLAAANAFDAASQTFEYTSDGAVGPTINLDHDSTTPAASDTTSIISRMRDSAGNLDEMASIDFILDDPTSTSEDAHIGIQTKVAGTKANRFNFGAGLYADGNSDPGAGAIDANEIYDDGVKIVPTGLDWASYSPSLGTNYQNTTGKTIYITMRNTAAAYVYFFCDTFSPPTTQRVWCYGGTPDAFCVVPPGYYYKFTVSAGSGVFGKVE